MGCSTSSTAKQVKGDNSTKQSKQNSIVPPEVFAQQANIVKPNVEKLVSLFEDTDKDKSRFVDTKELKNLFSKIGIEANDQLIAAMLSIVDDNNNGRIEQKEFCQIIYILSNMGNSCSRERIMFLNADKDFSGTIDFSEFEYIIKHIGKDKGNDANKKIFAQLCKQGENVVTYHVFCYAIDKLLTE